MARVDLDDVGLNVEDAGRGDALVLLHGFTGSAAQWHAHAAAFRDTFRTVAIDLLGHGGSSCPHDPRRYDMGHGVADLAAVLDRLGIARAHWLGYSMGGRVALAFALRHPERVGRLILESASPGIEDSGERAARVAEDEALARRIERDGTERFIDDWLAQPMFASLARLDPAARESDRAARRGHQPAGLANSLRGMGAGAQPSYWDRLGEVRAPTLLLVGSEDRKFLAIARAMRARMPDAQLAVLDHAGHNAHLEAPAAFRRVVLDFLGGAPVDAPRPGPGRVSTAPEPK